MPIWRIFCSELNLLLSIRSLFRICSVITFRTCKTLLEFWTSKLPLMDYVFVSLLIGINMIYKNSMDHLTFNSTLDSVLYESSFYRVKFVYLIKIWVWINTFFFFICTCGNIQTHVWPTGWRKSTCAVSLYLSQCSGKLCSNFSS